jgi:subtilisin family serine protease
MRLAKGIALSALLLITFAASAFAGEIHPALAELMDMTPGDETLSVIVTMSEQAPIAQMNHNLKLQRATRQLRHQQVVHALQDAARSQDDLKTWLDSSQRNGSIAGWKGYWIANLMVVSATPEAITAIAMRPDVDFVESNFTVSLIDPMPAGGYEPAEDSPSRGAEPGIKACRIPQVWNELGITGAGAIIASCDTGVDGNHPTLSNRWRGNHAPASECWLDNLGASSFPTDGHGHGTHTTGTMAGVAGSDSIGCAPDAEWIACNAIDQGVSSEFDNDVIDSFQWFADPDGDPFTVDDVPDVVQNSWGINEGFGGDYVDCDVRWWAVIDNAEAAGVVSVWSAGNEGPSGTSLRSPADRATTEFNCFSVGAVDATSDITFPYNMASFSSRGPTGCNVAPELKIKPEIVAPGVNVRSAAAGGSGFTSMSGTSMAGPHIAGIVGLMRSANPDLDADTIKLILMETARDQDSAGEDNTSGWGMVDAYAAVLAATDGYGAIEGYVYNASWSNSPLPGAMVELLGTSFDYTTDATGFYEGNAGADTYTASASRTGFSTEEATVVIESDLVATQHFYLTDIAGPEITAVTDFGFTNDNVGPYTIDAHVEDFSTVGAVTLYYKINASGWITLPMTGAFGDYSADIPGAPAHSTIKYYVLAEDGLAQSSTFPPNAPLTTLEFFITEVSYSFDAEGGNGDWIIGAAGDAATTGIWENADPVGTDYSGTIMQSEDDHTANPGSYCFVTGAAGGAAGDNDVDGGCTTLTSPVFDLTGAGRAFVSYWRWYAEAGFSTDDNWLVEVNDGSGWVELELLPGMANSWTRVALEIGDFVALTSSVQFRFLACDEGDGGLVEAAVDDFSIETILEDLTAAPGDEMPQHWSQQLMQSRPNPFHPGDGPVSLRFSMGEAGPAKVQVFDISGRLVRTLASGAQTAGEHNLHWDGRDAQGQALSSGVYFYRLQTESGSVGKSLVLIR